MVSMVVFFGIINFRILFCALDYYVALGLVTSSLRSRVIAHTHTHTHTRLTALCPGLPR